MNTKTQNNRDERFRSLRTAVVEDVGRWELSLLDSIFYEVPRALETAIDTIKTEAEPGMPELSPNLKRTLALEFIRAAAGRLIAQLDRKPAAELFPTMTDALSERPIPAPFLAETLDDEGFSVWEITADSYNEAWSRVGAEVSE